MCRSEPQGEAEAIRLHDASGADIEADEVAREQIKRRIDLVKGQLLGESAKPPKHVDVGWLVSVLFAPGYTR